MAESFRGINLTSAEEKLINFALQRRNDRKKVEDEKRDERLLLFRASLKGPTITGITAVRI